MDSIDIIPAAGPVRGTIRPPGSKSITNRALVCAALAQGESVLTGGLDSEDTRVMIAALGALGIRVAAEERGRVLRVAGCGGSIPAKRAELFVANSGTTMRFLTALVALGHGEYRLDGVPRMRERPMGDQAEALRLLGADVVCEGAGECPPIVVRGNGLPGGAAAVGGGTSSQFLSGLLMAAPYAQRDVRLTVSGPLVSAPYVGMTRRVMESFAAEVAATADYREIQVSCAKRYQGRQYAIEPDASAASYFLAAAAITGGRVTIQGLSRNSLQGDVAFATCLEEMGAVVAFDDDSITVEGRPLAGVDVDMNAISDTVPTLAVVALFAKGRTRISNVAHIRHKETDRIAALACELRKLGAEVEEFADGLTIEPRTIQPAAIDTYNDHRMAMSFALAGLRAPGLTINDPGCVGKT
ncbi:MAG TPA: 3-phosphoshikimate 1-carboxyvinyltransferase, partial [Lacipirellulaceae bacterium]|nr:3-phosphoshikimate 1-carboxyvinyltransferase [Lacipirellulaceae bacterium]